MALYESKSVSVVSGLQGLGEVLFRGVEGEPSPATFLLFTIDRSGQVTTPNQLLTSKGEDAILKVLSEYFEHSDLHLLLVRLNISKAEKLMYHPFLRLRAYPTLMSVDGECRLAGDELLDRLLLRELFSRRVISSDPPLLMQCYFPEAGELSSTLQASFSPTQTRVPLHPDLCFWKVREAARRVEETRQELQDYGVRSEEDGLLLRERILQELVRLVRTEDLPEEVKEHEEIVPLDLDVLVDAKEELSVERKSRPIPPSLITTPKKKKERKKNKNKGRGKGKNKAKGNKGKKVKGKK